MAVGFFFQAEDGIRDLVRSRGLGDVYKRQGPQATTGTPQVSLTAGALHRVLHQVVGRPGIAGPVSYTHLTLPTSDLV